MIANRLVIASIITLVTVSVLYFRWQALVSAAAAAAVRDENTHRIDRELPAVDRGGEYVSSEKCQACHRDQHASWHASFHRTMTQTAMPGNVVGQFDGSEVMVNGLNYRVFRRGDEFWAEMPDPDAMMYIVQGESQGISKKTGPLEYLIKKAPDAPVQKIDLRQVNRAERRVVMSTGSHHYQTYWVESKHDRLLQTLPLVYLIKDKRWIPREAAFMHPPEPTHIITQWNHHCIQCHSTGGNPGLNPETGMLDSTVVELGISCEACHGPAAEHIRVNRSPLRRYGLHLTGQDDPTIVNPAKLDHDRSSQVCGQCHGVFIQRQEFAMQFAKRGVLYRPGDDLHKTRNYIQFPSGGSAEARRAKLEKNETFYRERWWDDGTILAGGREFSALSVSRCFTHGKMSCLTCHSMHDSDPVDQLKLEMDTSTACVQCHQEARFTSDISVHTHHQAESTGGNCLNCHMPHTTYALFGAIRSHQIVAPRVASSIEYGVPNACNLCHLDKTLEWTQRYMTDWYNHDSHSLTAEQREVAASVVWLLKGHAAQRAITAWHVGWRPAQEASGTNWLAPFQAELLADPYGVVRYIAAAGLRTLPGFETFEYDFLVDQNGLRKYVSAATDRWNRAHPRGLGVDRPELLLDAGGRLDRERLSKLLSERDDRPVTIKE